MVTHDPLVAQRAGRVLHLDKGKLVDDVLRDERARIGAAS
jgi:putative ABC transport system ATP-binding protein